MYAKYARTARKTLQKMLTIKEITSIIMHHLPSIQIEDCGSRNKPPTVIGMPSVFYYITLREKCQTVVSVAFARISIGYPQLSSQNRLDKSAKMHKKREPASTADDLLSRKRLKKNAGQCRRFLLSGKESCCRTVCF